MALMDSRISYFLKAYFAEVSVTVPPVPGVDLEQYQLQLIVRFANVHIKDKLQVPRRARPPARAPPREAAATVRARRHPPE